MTGYFKAAAWRLEGRRSVQRDTQIRRWLASRSCDWVYARRISVLLWSDRISGSVSVCTSKRLVPAPEPKFRDFMLSILRVV